MRENRSSITRVLGLVTITILALCLLLVLLTGASAYAKLVDKGDASYNRRTALQYLTTRVRQAERVEIGDLEGCPTLRLLETIDGETYITHVYCYEGWLQELYAVPEAKLPPQAGEKILELERFSAQLEGNLLQLRVGDEELFLCLNAGRLVAP